MGVCAPKRHCQGVPYPRVGAALLALLLEKDQADAVLWGLVLAQLGGLI